MIISFSLPSSHHPLSLSSKWKCLLNAGISKNSSQKQKKCYFFLVMPSTEECGGGFIAAPLVWIQQRRGFLPRQQFSWSQEQFHCQQVAEALWWTNSKPGLSTALPTWALKLQICSASSCSCSVHLPTLYHSARKCLQVVLFYETCWGEEWLVCGDFLW